MFEVVDTGYIEFCPMTILSTRRYTLSQPTVGQPFEGGINPTEAKSLLDNGEVGERIGFRSIAPIGCHPTMMSRGIVLFKPKAQLLTVAGLQKKVYLHVIGKN